MRRWVRWIGVCAWLAWAAVAQGASDVEVLTETDPEILRVLNEADALLKQQKSSDAYGLLAGHEAQLGGNPSFDYLLGVAALDSGKPSEAVFALRRVVLAEPRFAGARLELARAQFEIGEYELARTQFQYLLTQSPPENTRAVIEHYLDSIPGRAIPWSRPWQLAERIPWRRLGTRDRWSALAQFGAGYDSNANGSTSEQTFLGFTLNPNNVETSSSFGELSLSGNYTLPFSSTSGLITNGQLSHRANTDASFVDQTIASLGSTMVWLRGPYRFTAGLDGYKALLDGSDHESGINLNAGVARRFADYEAALSLRAGKLDYVDQDLSLLDANRYLAGLSVTRLNLFDGKARAGATLFAGTDDTQRSGSPYANDRKGLRLFGSWALRADSTIFAELSGMTTDYDGTFFSSPRKDHLYGVTVAFDLQNFPAEKWSLAPRLRYLQNDSKISLYEYDRVEAVVFIRRDF